MSAVGWKPSHFWSLSDWSFHGGYKAKTEQWYMRVGDNLRIIAWRRRLTVNMDAASGHWWWCHTGDRHLHNTILANSLEEFDEKLMSNGLFRDVVRWGETLDLEFAGIAPPDVLEVLE